MMSVCMAPPVVWLVRVWLLHGPAHASRAEGARGQAAPQPPQGRGPLCGATRGPRDVPKGPGDNAGREHAILEALVTRRFVQKHRCDWLVMTEDDAYVNLPRVRQLLLAKPRT